MDEGKDLSVIAKAGQIAIEKARPKLTIEKLLADINPENLHGEQDWGQPVGSEVW